jgi:AmmeMemoRadiSam system protein B/AmmeMemoRadiSam system protein A
MVRQPAVAGSFYPADAKALRSELTGFFEGVEDKTTDDHIAAIIVPHAGYIFSGSVAASAWIKINPEHNYKHVFILGTCHYAQLNGASIYNQGDYLTPLGRVPVDIELANNLIASNSLFSYVPEAHTREHSIEVQLPFLQYRMKTLFKVIPIVIGTQSAENCKNLARALEPYFTPENLFVISSDFSHYPGYQGAIEADRATGLAIVSNNPATFIKILKSNEEKQIPGLATSACGWNCILTLLDIASRDTSLRVENLKYMNSGNSPYGDKDRVVGYHAFAFTRGNTAVKDLSFSLDNHEKQVLLMIAREAISSKLKGQPLNVIDKKNMSPNLLKKCGAFVTLNLKGRLRGCVGIFMVNEPLYNVVQQMALAAAFQDYRFPPLTADEFTHTEIEISVLTPLKRIRTADEFQLGKQGIYMIKGRQSGTFLPQVAESTGWSKEEFLGHCARDKAGIGWDGWKDAELYTYEALVFDEKQLIPENK